MKPASEDQPKPVRWVGSSGRLRRRYIPGSVTVQFAQAVHVLHAFQKKSKRGAATPKAELDLIEQRLKRAREDYEQWSKSDKPTSR